MHTERRERTTFKDIAPQVIHDVTPVPYRDTMAKQNRLLVTKTVRLKKEALNVRYAELGDPAKPPVLLLHGVPENLQAWYAVAPLLAENYHVLALDWPGFGGSDADLPRIWYQSLSYRLDSLQASPVRSLRRSRSERTGLDRFGSQGSIAQAAVWSDGVVMPSPALNQHFCFQ